MTRSRVPATILVCLCSPLLLAPSCTIRFVTPERATSTETKTFALPAGAVVVVSNQIGSTAVIVDDAATQASVQIVRVAYAASEAEAEELLALMEVTITQPTAEDNRLMIDAKVPPGATTNQGNFTMVVSDDDVVISTIFGRSRVAKYALSITLPPGHAVQASQTAGTIRATGLDETSSLSGSSASIRLMDCLADVTVETDAGSVSVSNHAGSLTADVSNGSLNVDIAALAADDAVNGQVGNGSIDMTLPAGINANLEAAAAFGLVSFDVRDFTAVTVDIKTISYIRVQLNAGGPVINLRTDKGSIDIDSR